MMAFRSQSAVEDMLQDRKRPLVYTEFVYQSPGAKEVFVCGDWNSWNPIRMENQTGKKKARGSRGKKGPFWVLITPVPEGYHEFCFLVDGGHKISYDHPRNEDNQCNWRNIQKPAEEDKAQSISFADSLRLALPKVKLMRLLSGFSDSIRKHTSRMEEEYLVSPSSDMKADGNHLWASLRPAVIFNAAMLSYFAMYFIARDGYFLSAVA